MNQSTTAQAPQVDDESGAGRNTSTDAQIACRTLLSGLRAAATDRRLADLVAELQRGELGPEAPKLDPRLDRKGKIESDALDLAERVTASIPLALPLGRHHVPELDAPPGPPEATGEGAPPAGRSRASAPPRGVAPSPGPVADVPPGWSITPRTKPEAAADGSNRGDLGPPVSGDDHPGATEPTPPDPLELEFLGKRVRCLAKRVDWLTVAFRLALDSERLDGLVGRLREAGPAGRVLVQLGGADWQLTGARSEGTFFLRNLTCTAKIDTKGSERWILSVEFSGAQIAELDPRRAVEIARRIADGLGTREGERVRRLDLCADVAGWDLGETDGEAWVKPQRARLAQLDAAALEKGERPELRTYRRGSRMTGFHLCPGGDLQLVVYDKREELQIRADKREGEEARWQAAGWTDDEPVTRVEFRLRGAVLHELEDPTGAGLRDGDNAIEHLDRIWAYCSREWVRLAELGTDVRLTRCAIDPRWEIVRAVRFEHESPPALRLRKRGGASAAQALGAAMSLAAAAGCIEGITLPVDPDGEELSEADAIAAMTSDAQERLLTHWLFEVFMVAAALVRADLVQRLGGTAEAATFVLYRLRATRARFSRVPPP